MYETTCLINDIHYSRVQLSYMQPDAAAAAAAAPDCRC